MGTLLSTLLNRYNRIQSISVLEDQYKVMDFDEAIRTIKRTIKFPWSLTAKNLKVFSGIELYSTESDFDRIAFIDDVTRKKLFKPNFQYTSIKQFYEDPTNRNLLSEIWENGTKKIGIKYKNIGLSQIVLDDCQDISKYSISGDFTSLEEEIVETAAGEHSIKAICLKDSDSASLTCNIEKLIDENYKKKYFFAYIYFPSVPDSVDLKISKDGSNYLSKNILTQFDGSIFKSGEFNILAFDLNNCENTGETSGEFNSFEIIINGTESGNYYFGETYLKEWKKLNYQYYSKNLIKTSSGSYKEQFLDNSDNSFDLLDELIGEDIFSDVILYEAETNAINEKENQAIYNKAELNRQNAWNSLFETYPDLSPEITTDYYNFVDNINKEEDEND